MQTAFDDRLELFFGAATESICHVYARLATPDPARRWQLAGTLVGPACAYASTLPATYRFTDRTSPTGLLAEALVPDPCYWTPQLPHLYDVELELVEDGRVVETVRRGFGIRRLAADKRTRNWMFDGASWVLRGATAEALPQTDLGAWREAETVMCVRNPNDALCEAASRQGVLLLAKLGGNELDEVVRLRRWPAVGLIAVAASTERDLSVLGLNAQLVQQSPVGGPLVPAAWADAVMVEMSPHETELPDSLADCPLPVVVHRPAGPLSSVADGRAACDRLQRDLAPCGQFAGYIV